MPFLGSKYERQTTKTWLLLFNLILFKKAFCECPLCSKRSINTAENKEMNNTQFIYSRVSQCSRSSWKEYINVLGSRNKIKAERLIQIKAERLGHQPMYSYDSQIYYSCPKHVLGSEIKYDIVENLNIRSEDVWICIACG